jgi:hypothetical protein
MFWMKVSGQMNGNVILSLLFRLVIGITLLYLFDIIIFRYVINTNLILQL